MPPSLDLAFAKSATPVLIAVLMPRHLQDRLLALLVACCAKPMRWLGVACVSLQHVGKRTRKHTLEFILLLLAIPCFKASDFCFQCAYAGDLSFVYPLARGVAPII